MKPIGTFFGKIFGGLWNWIKETAWIQPLLIVGTIFAIIFSIPTITEWVNGIAESINSPESYYRNYQKKLEGEEAVGAKIVEVSIEAPLKQIAVNAGLEGGVVVE
ncbi:MAG: hypothetical protein RJA80_943, partial [Actinomycetota bacterium]